MAREFILVDPAKLHLPGSRLDGASQAKLDRHLASFGTSITGQPPPEVKRGSDGDYVIYDGVTRATPAAKYHPGVPILVEVTGRVKQPLSDWKRIEETL